jgi:hypothetical protein
MPETLQTMTPTCLIETPTVSLTLAAEAQSGFLHSLFRGNERNVWKV